MNDQNGPPTSALPNQVPDAFMRAAQTPLPQRAEGGEGGAAGTTPLTGVGISRAMQMAALQHLRTEALPTMAEIAGDGFRPAAAVVKCILTPLLGGSAAELIDVEESMRPMRTYQFAKNLFKFADDGSMDPVAGTYDAAKFLEVHPEGARAFSAYKDQRAPTQQTPVLIAAEHIEAAASLYRSVGFNVVVTSGKFKTKFNFAVAISLRPQRQVEDQHLAGRGRARAGAAGADSLLRRDVRPR